MRGLRINPNCYQVLDADDIICVAWKSSGGSDGLGGSYHVRGAIELMQPSGEGMHRAFWCVHRIMGLGSGAATWLGILFTYRTLEHFSGWRKA